MRRPGNSTRWPPWVTRSTGASWRFHAFSRCGKTGQERVVAAHRLEVARVVVVGLFERRHEGQLEEVHRVVALAVGGGEGAGESSSRARREPELVCVHVQEPVGVERRGELRLALRAAGASGRRPAREGLEPGEAAAAVALGDLDRRVRRLVVDQVHLDAVRGVVLDAVRDEPLLVVRRKQGDDAARGQHTAVERERAHRAPSLSVRRSDYGGLGQVGPVVSLMNAQKATAKQLKNGEFISARRSGAHVPPAVVPAEEVAAERVPEQRGARRSGRACRRTGTTAAARAAGHVAADRDRRAVPGVGVLVVDVAEAARADRGSSRR